MKQALLIFSKNPILGEVKTRLAATVGNDMALSVYQYLLQHTASLTCELPVNKIVFYSSIIEKQDEWCNTLYNKQVQQGTDLGERMRNAFAYAFHEGNEQVVIIGTDCLELTPAIILQAFAQLKNHDAVIGPATDGGYYLLGMKQLHLGLFQQISWSTGDVLKQTLLACANQKLTFFLLPELSDIDDENDLKKVKQLFTLIK